MQMEIMKQKLMYKLTNKINVGNLNIPMTTGSDKNPFPNIFVA